MVKLIKTTFTRIRFQRFFKKKFQTFGFSLIFVEEFLQQTPPFDVVISCFSCNSCYLYACKLILILTISYTVSLDNPKCKLRLAHDLLDSTLICATAD